MIVFNEGGVIGKRIFLRDWIEYVKLDLNKNSEIEPHVLDIDVDFYILEGNGFFIHNSKNIPVSKHDLVSVNSGDSRGIKAIDSELSVLVIKHLGHRK